MDLIKIKDIFTSPDINKNIIIGGWVRAFRAKKFIELNDGSTIKNIQCVIFDSSIDEKIIKKISIGCSLKVKGNLVKSMEKVKVLRFKYQVLKYQGNQIPINILFSLRNTALSFLESKLILELELQHLAL